MQITYSLHMHAYQCVRVTSKDEAMHRGGKSAIIKSSVSVKLTAQRNGRTTGSSAS